MSDALGKLTQMVEDVACVAEKRSGIINLIRMLESSRAEVAWLVAYEQDEDRYKGRTYELLQHDCAEPKSQPNKYCCWRFTLCCSANKLALTEQFLVLVAGRDSNRKLQQALKVGRIRDKMPAMIEKLRASIAEWEEVIIRVQKSCIPANFLYPPCCCCFLTLCNVQYLNPIFLAHGLTVTTDNTMLLA